MQYGICTCTNSVTLQADADSDGVFAHIMWAKNIVKPFDRATLCGQQTLSNHWTVETWCRLLTGDSKAGILAKCVQEAPGLCISVKDLQGTWKPWAQLAYRSGLFHQAQARYAFGAHAAEARCTFVLAAQAKYNVGTDAGLCAYEPCC